MIDDDFKLISKYALLLSASYLIEVAINKYVGSFDTKQMSYNESILIAEVPLLLTILFNIIISVIVYRDKMKLKIETPYVILATVIYRPVGVVAFLLYSIFNHRTDNKQPIR